VKFLLLETEFRRDERIMRFLTVSLDKHAISWAEEEQNLNLKSIISWQHYNNLLQEKRRRYQISYSFKYRNKQKKNTIVSKNLDQIYRL
jgi:hypothetical protein